MSIYLKDIKKGQVFYECQYGQNMEWTATEDPRTEGDQTKLFAKRKNGQLLELMQTKGFEHYVKFYSEPEYICRVDGKICVVTI